MGSPVWRYLFQPDGLSSVHTNEDSASSPRLSHSFHANWQGQSIWIECRYPQLWVSDCSVLSTWVRQWQLKALQSIFSSNCPLLYPTPLDPSRLLTIGYWSILAWGGEQQSSVVFTLLSHLLLCSLRLRENDVNVLFRAELTIHIFSILGHESWHLPLKGEASLIKAESSFYLWV